MQTNASTLHTYWTSASVMQILLTVHHVELMYISLDITHQPLKTHISSVLNKHKDTIRTPIRISF